jgi:23S rRNA pseudouridine1911/1915/1917 synthase
MASLRLDQALARLFGQFSRARLQDWIRAGRVSVDGKALRAKDRVRGGERIRLLAEMHERLECEPQPIPLDIRYEDASVLVICKPAGLVTHPAAGNPDRTLQNALLHHDGTLAALPRAGIVHRLDKETSGLLVVARTAAAHKSLVAQLQAREVKREYLALVVGELTAGGTVDAPIGRHPLHRKRMAVVPSGKSAVTHYRVLERFQGYTLLGVRLESGRTHQIRVHMAYLGHPLVGDPTYGGRPRLASGLTPALRDAVTRFKRQALHARVLGLRHPSTGQWMQWKAEPPADMRQLLGLLGAKAGV